MSKTNYLQAVISDLQRTAGPYRCARRKRLETEPNSGRSNQLGHVERLQRIDLVDRLSFPIPFEKPQNDLVRR